MSQIPLRFLYYTSASPAADIALEEAIHAAVEAGLSPNTWRVWQAAQPAVILGTGQESAKEAQLETARAEGSPVLRRHSGGGAVVIGPGVINFSAFYRYDDLPGSGTIRGAMSAALSYVRATLCAWNIESCEAGLSDLAVNCADGTLRKIAGNSQARKKHSVVVHGTLLADPDFSRITRLLRFPSSMPDYRAGREHRAFLTSLREQNAPCGFDSFTEGLLAALPSGIYIDREPRSLEREGAARLLDDKYSKDEWNFRR